MQPFTATTFSKRLTLFATMLSFTGAGIALFTKLSGLPLIFAALYIVDRTHKNINILPKNKVWLWFWIGVGIVITLEDLRELLTIIQI